MDAISDVFRNAVMSGRRVRLADPQGRWVNSQLGGELSGIQNYPGLINSLRVVNPEGEYPELATQYALSFSQVRAYTTSRRGIGRRHLLTQNMRGSIRKKKNDKPEARAKDRQRR